MNEENVPQNENNVTFIEGSPEGRKRRNTGLLNTQANTDSSYTTDPSPARSSAAWALTSLLTGGQGEGSDGFSDPPASSLITNSKRGNSGTSTSTENSKKKKLSRNNSMHVPSIRKVDANKKLSRNNSVESTQSNLSRSSSIETAKTLSRNNSMDSIKNLSRNNSMEYCRRDKSLSNLCSKFLELNGECPATSTAISLDNAAAALGVERRRIYDIVNILEPLSYVTRLRKNTYLWQGSINLFNTLRSLQLRGIISWPQEASKAGMSLSEEQILAVKEVEAEERQQDSDCSSSEESTRTLSQMCSKFVQLFLVGNECVSLKMAYEKSLPPPHQNTLEPSQRSKLRRLYDLANVLTSLKLITKLKAEKGKTKQGEKDPCFKWTGPSVLDIFRGVNRDALPLSLDPPPSLCQSLKTTETKKDTQDSAPLFRSIPPLPRAGLSQAIELNSNFSGYSSLSPSFLSQSSTGSLSQENQVDRHLYDPNQDADSHTPPMFSPLGLEASQLLSPPLTGARRPEGGGGGGGAHLESIESTSATSGIVRPAGSLPKSDVLQLPKETFQLKYGVDWPYPNQGETSDLPIPPTNMLEFQVERLRKFMDNYQDRWYCKHPLKEGEEAANIFEAAEIRDSPSNKGEMVNDPTLSSHSQHIKDEPQKAGSELKPSDFSKIMSPSYQATAGTIKRAIECENMEI